MTIGAVAPGFRDTSLSRSKVLKGIKDCRLAARALFATFVRPLPELGAKPEPPGLVLLGWRVGEDARVDTEIAGQSAEVAGIEPASARQDLRKRELE